jgi:hypothetical protein
MLWAAGANTANLWKWKKMAACITMFNKSFKGYRSSCTSTFQVLANKKSSTPVINAIPCSQWLPRLTLESGVPVFLFTGEFSPNFNLDKIVSTYTRIFHVKIKTPQFARFSRFFFKSFRNRQIFIVSSKQVVKNIEGFCIFFYFHF